MEVPGRAAGDRAKIARYYTDSKRGFNRAWREWACPDADLIGVKAAMRPAIGVTSGFDVAPTVRPPRERLTLLAPYSDAIYAAGGIPRPLAPPPTHDDALLDALLAGLDGLVFTGGPDLNPRHYGQPLHPKTQLMHERRDAFDVDLFRRADAARIPIFAICLGFQVAHVARGGKLIQHVDDAGLTPPVTHHISEGSAYHPVAIEADSRLAGVIGASELEVNSRHHQAVDPSFQGRDLRPVAFSPDGLPEASEDCEGRFLIAVQWHPEDLCDRPEHRRLFEALVQAAAG